MGEGVQQFEIAAQRVKEQSPAMYARTQTELVCEAWLRLHWAEHEALYHRDPTCTLCRLNITEFHSAVIHSLAQMLGIPLLTSKELRLARLIAC